MQQNDFVQKVLDIISSSDRKMPAHFTSNGNRTQSFCIDFDISETDEYEMASEAWSRCPDKSIIKNWGRYYVGCIYCNISRRGKIHSTDILVYYWSK